MKILRLALPAFFLLTILFFSGCGGERTTSTETSRDIVVTLRNLTDSAVHMFFEGYKVGADNLVNPQSSIQVTITAHRIGHKFSFYVVDAADPEGQALWTTTSIEVTERSYNSGSAELHWVGDNLLFIGW